MIILLHEPQMAENIGAVARVMLNCGLKNLRLINPRDGWPNQNAYPMAAGADEILDNVKVFKTFEEAAHELTHIHATTVRPRGLNIPVIASDKISNDIKISDKTGFVFGGERSGLPNEIIVKVNSIITIPTNPSFPSLNLAQAVFIIAYEAMKNKFPVQEKTFNHATVKERQLLIKRLINTLAQNSFFKTPEKRIITQQKIEVLFSRTLLSSSEIKLIHGMLSVINK